MTSRTSQPDRINDIVKTTVIGFGCVTFALSFVAMMLLTIHVLTPKTALNMGEPVASTVSATQIATHHASASTPAVISHDVSTPTQAPQGAAE